MDTDYKFIHLLYVPTMNCNMGCSYCYLADNTRDKTDDNRNSMTGSSPLDTLIFAIDKFKKSSVMPFNISLHGGEVTTLSKHDFHDLIKYISDYYDTNAQVIKAAGFKTGRPHIKTNLYDLEKHIDTIREFNVSISGSLDLPFSLHETYRLTKGGNKTLDKILKNLELLASLPCKKKVSATIFKEHFEHLDEIVEDIKYLHKNTCLDMNDFNFMIGFDYNSNSLLHHMSEDMQLELYNRMHEEFDGSDLDYGVNGPWFDEFGPSYCSNCDNCGEKFFLLERNGDIYSCVRGQKNPDFYYGNIFKDSVNDILITAKRKIFEAHDLHPLNKDCISCSYLYLCKTGCPFVKRAYNSDKSYTCKLQQALYKDRNYSADINNAAFVAYYNSLMRSSSNPMIEEIETSGTFPENSLRDLIQKDQKLKYIYDDDCFILDIDGKRSVLASQLLKTEQEIAYITDKSKVKVYMRRELIEALCDYPENNSCYIMLLSGDLVTYGDEGRCKQRHIASQQVYKGVLDSTDSDMEGFYCIDLTNFIHSFAPQLTSFETNNIFFTTSALRDYHYNKQKNNAYYHIEAINLPFQNMDFYYLSKDSLDEVANADFEAL